MKRTLKFALLATLLLLASIFTLTACKKDEHKDDTPHVHTEVIDEAVTPTCTTSGLTEGSHCSVCSEVLVAQTVVDALGHSYVDGVCSECGEADPDYVAPHVHSYEAVVTNPTCTEAGYTTYTCECGDSYTADEIDALGHTEADAVIENKVESTCTTAGSYDSVVYCSVCDGELSRETATVDALGHNFANDICTRCGKVASEGLKYTLSNDGTYYIVSGIGTCTDADVVIPSKYNGLPVTSIGSYAFAHCDSLASITIPDSVISIGYGAFSGCESLKYNEYNNAYYLGNDSNPYLVLIKAKDTSITSCIINENTKFICNSAFSNCSSLTSITIPDSVTSIGGSAFYRCTSLTTVTIGNRVTSIGDYAFAYCKSLTSITIPDSVTSIGDYAFSDCRRLTSVTIGNGVTSIGGYAFWGCSSLVSITIPDSITSIGERAFVACSGLTSITIPDSVTSIGERAFYSCDSLTSIKVDENNKYYTSIDGNLYTKDGETLIQYAIGKSDTEFTIPDSVTSIGSGAFEYCTSLDSITIPDSVTSIGERAFYYCTSLTSITIPDSVTSIGDSAFFSCDSLTSVTIGNGVTSIGREAFGWCESLTSITFEGTVEQWNAISLGSSWKYNVPATEVICSDGTVTL